MIDKIIQNRRLRFVARVVVKHDFAAGLTVFLVALPLCLGIALASGTPLASGLISGIVGGMVVSVVSKSALSVSGPAAGLTTLVAAALIQYNSYSLFLTTVVAAGLIQIVLGLLRWGAVANYFPSSVIKGMLAAIGVILISKQLPIALGYDQSNFWSNEFIEPVKHFRFFEKAEFFKHLTWGVCVISVISLALLLIWTRPYFRRFKLFPISLIVVIVSIILVNIFKFVPFLELKAGQLVSVPRNIFAEITFPDVSALWTRVDVWKTGLFIAVLASLESLLCVEAIDKMDKYNRSSPPNRELVAQGVGNLVCGLLGGIPITAVIVRGAANVEAGGRTRASSFIHGFLLLVAVVSIPFLLNQIPLAALASILILTGYRLARPSLWRQMFLLGWNQFLPFMITIVVILATDLLMGVTIGILISMYFIIREQFKPQYSLIKKMEHETPDFIIKFGSGITFLNKAHLKSTLDKIPNYSIVEIDGSDAAFVDHDILELLADFQQKAHLRHIQLVFKNVQLVEVSAGH